MDQRNKRFAELARKWIDGTITEEEKKEFAQWYDQDPESPIVIPPSFAVSEEELHHRMLGNILKRKDGEAILLRLRKKRFLQIAAAVLLVVGSAIVYRYFFTPRLSSPIAKSNVNAVKGNQIVSNEIVPGGNKAVLLLADGSKIVLDSASNGTIAGDPATKFIKLNDGQLRLSSAGKPHSTAYNTLSTPRGGQYAITLADGTTVWLNSASSLYFPNAFTGKERVVELTGEAYFEVAKNPAQPFTVKVNEMEVKVLGTHFNVMAYRDEEAVQTTLLEGSVRIQQQAATALLKPGQQAAVKAGGAIRVSNPADIEQAVAWKNGYFNFEGATIETIMRQLARWYPVDVVYARKIPVHFTGTIAKNVGIGKVFHMLELTGAVHFSVNGNKVTVR